MQIVNIATLLLLIVGGINWAIFALGGATSSERYLAARILRSPKSSIC